MSTLIATVVALALAHQYLAYAVVLLVAALEAFPVVGAAVPGDPIILGISAIAATGALRLWPLIMAATLGAIISDGLAYWLGRHNHAAITRQWPLNRHPALISRGEAFFRRHGGKAVFIARFTPGVRAVVPLIAGMLLMPASRFYAMNILSAAIWGPAHILAGVAIGASLTLLGAVASRLAVFVILLIALLVVMVWLTRLAVRCVAPFAIGAPDRIRGWARRRDTWFRRRISAVLDPARTEVPGLAVLGAILMASVWAFIAVLQDVVAGDPLVRASIAVFHFLQALRTAWFDRIMVAITELGGATVTIAVTLAMLLWFVWRRDWRGCGYTVASVGGASLFTLLLKVTLREPRPYALHANWDAFSFPSGHSTANAALYGFLTIVVAWEVGFRWRLAVATASGSLVTAIAFSRIYLGAHWLSDVLAGMAFGLGWAALLGIAYLRRGQPPAGVTGLGAGAMLTLLIAGTATIGHQHAADMHRYAVREQSRTMELADWWRDGWSELPARRIDISGESEEPLTFEWAGSLEALKDAVAAGGWAEPVPWTVRSALGWLVPGIGVQDLPVLPRLENGRQEALVMIRPAAADTAGHRFVLRLWRSNVVLGVAGPARIPLWIGMVTEERAYRIGSFLTLAREVPAYDGPRDVLAGAIASRRLAARSHAEGQAGWDGRVLLGQVPRQ